MGVEKEESVVIIKWNRRSEFASWNGSFAVDSLNNLGYTDSSLERLEYLNPFTERN